jgi:hypothetical protein
MSVRYIDSEEARFTENDGIFVDVEFFEDKEVILGIQPRRLFPVSGGRKYISLLDKSGVEQAVIRDLDQLMPESRAVVEHALSEYYMIPHITRLLKMTEDKDVWHWTAETDRGTYTFEIRNHLQSIKPLYGGRVLIKDANDNRYEIPDINKLDKKSLKMIMPNL